MWTQVLWRRKVRQYWDSRRVLDAKPYIKTSTVEKRIERIAKIAIGSGFVRSNECSRDQAMRVGSSIVRYRSQYALMPSGIKPLR